MANHNGGDWHITPPPARQGVDPVQAAHERMLRSQEQRRQQRPDPFAQKAQAYSRFDQQQDGINSVIDSYHNNQMTFEDGVEIAAAYYEGVAIGNSIDAFFAEHGAKQGWKIIGRTLLNAVLTIAFIAGLFFILGLIVGN